MTGKPKTLLLITPGFAANEADSTCIPSVQIFVRTLNSLRPDVKVLIATLHYPKIKSTYSWNSNLVISLNGSALPKWLRFIFWISAYHQLKKIISHQNTVGILSLWCNEPALLGKILAKKYSINHLIWLHGQDTRKNNHYVKLIKPRPDELVAMSWFLSEEFFRNHGIRPSYIVGNGVSPKMFEGIAQQKVIDVLAVGSLSSLKQFSIFIDVIFQLHKVFPELKAQLCGDGPERKKLESKIQEHNLTSTIILTGELPHPDVIQKMRQSKILIHPSSFEGHSTVCIEGLAAGCQVVSFIFPDNRPIEKWSVVQSPVEMTATCQRLLQSNADFITPVIFPMSKSVEKILELFTI